MSTNPNALHITSPSSATRARARGLRSFALPARLMVTALLLTGSPPRAEDVGPGGQHHGPGSDVAMRAHADGYWATHERTGASSQALQGVPAATFTVGNFLFDNGGSAQVDTAEILIGESVMWQWITGFHTITNGTGSSDPSAGTLFNQPSDSENQQFTFTFISAGTYPFFCSFHELQNMKGIIIVSAPVDVEPRRGRTPLGFVRDPSPNPTQSGMTFRYALVVPGRTRAEVFDAKGRRLAVLLDRDLPAGEFTASWDGRAPGGPAPTGVYYVRLSLPGYAQSRRFAIRR